MVYYEHLHELGEKHNDLHINAIAPSRSLSSLVNRYMVLAPGTCFPDSQWYLLPDNSTYLIFYLIDQGKTVVPKLSIVGPRSTHQVISRQHRLFTFICSFRPGALRLFVDRPLDELKDRSVDACSLLKNYQQHVFEQLTVSAFSFNINRFVTTLESFLLSSIDRTSGVHPIVHKFYQQYLEQSVRQPLAIVSKHLGYSERQLRNLIQAHIGNAPKMVTQIERLTTSLRHGRAAQNWASVAYSSGYYDQSHMISDYHKLVGMSPEKLFSW
jgi:AraC-like DNA-binding protein